MTTPLQQAAQALIEQHLPTYLDQHVAELRKALDAEIAQSVEPYAVFHGLVDSGEHGAFNLDLLKMIPRGAYLYLHPPQQAREHRATEQLSKAFDAAVEVVGEHRVAKSLTEAQQVAVTSGERAELLRDLNAWKDSGTKTVGHLIGKAMDMLEADVQQAKPTGWDNGLSQDYCAEFGQWLASRPGARQQIKAMFDTSTPLQP